MSRRVLDDGRWFDDAKGEKWEEGTRWDGRNRVSLATGSQWDHQVLYRSASGAWILHGSSQWEGSRDWYREISADEAAAWLVRNEHDLPDELAEHEQSLEVEAPRTKARSFRLDAETERLLGDIATARKLSQTDVIRIAVRALAAQPDSHWPTP